MISLPRPTGPEQLGINTTGGLHHNQCIDQLGTRVTVASVGDGNVAIDLHVPAGTMSAVLTPDQARVLTTKITEAADRAAYIWTEPEVEEGAAS